jgi:hypothetical protein
MSNVKLHINITQGIIDAEGDHEFVWRVYEDFRNRLATTAAPSPSPVPSEVIDTESPHPQGIEVADEERAKKRPKKRQSSSQGNTGSKERGAPGVTSHRPKVLPNLDTTGVKEFLSQYQLTNHTNTIVAISKFLESKGLSPASFDAFFTCYSDSSLKVPEAFGQAFVTARGKGFINFITVNDVELTLRGKNHIDHGGIKKANA